MTHERSTLEAVVNARSYCFRTIGCATARRWALAVMAQAEGALSTAPWGDFCFGEAYPDLKGKSEHDAAFGRI